MSQKALENIISFYKEYYSKKEIVCDMYRKLYDLGNDCKETIMDFRSSSANIQSRYEVRQHKGIHKLR